MKNLKIIALKKKKKTYGLINLSPLKREKKKKTELQPKT